MYRMACRQEKKQREHISRCVCVCACVCCMCVCVCVCVCVVRVCVHVCVRVCVCQRECDGNHTTQLFMSLPTDVEDDPSSPHPPPHSSPSMSDKMKSYPGTHQQQRHKRHKKTTKKKSNQKPSPALDSSSTNHSALVNSAPAATGDTGPPLQVAANQCDPHSTQTDPHAILETGSSKPDMFTTRAGSNTITGSGLGHPPNHPNQRRGISTSPVELGWQETDSRTLAPSFRETLRQHMEGREQIAAEREEEGWGGTGSPLTSPDVGEPE